MSIGASNDPALFSPSDISPNLSQQTKSWEAQMSNGKYLLNTTLAIAAAGLLQALTANPAAAQQQLPAMTADNVPCAQVTKLPDGMWQLKGPVSISLGNAKNVSLGNIIVGPKGMDVGGVELYSLFESKCGRR
jgi:hypothetical protein